MTKQTTVVVIGSLRVSIDILHCGSFVRFDHILNGLSYPVSSSDEDYELGHI